MTTRVKVSAHCASDKQVRISRANENSEGHAPHPDVVIQDGQKHEQVVYDGWSCSVKEELKPA